MIEAAIAIIGVGLVGVIGLGIAAYLNFLETDRKLHEVHRVLWKLRHDLDWIIWRTKAGNVKEKFQKMPGSEPSRTDI